MYTRVASMVVAIGMSLTVSANAGDYKHKDWPVANDGSGIYSFTNTGESRAIALCTAYYTADVNIMNESGSATSVYGQVIQSHETTMRDAYEGKYTGDLPKMDELIKDMVWHFGNSAQYGNYQEFKDSANMACEGYAVDTGVITLEYLNSFNDKLLSGL